MEEFLRERQTRKQQREDAAALNAAASAIAPEMFRRLQLQIRLDVALYVEATGREVVYEGTESEFAVAHEAYPFFLVAATLPPTGSYQCNVVECLEARKPYEGRVELYRRFGIEIVARTLNEFCYGLNGEEYDKEAKVSQLLLEGVLASLG
jgi:hypothetical protein